MADIFMVASRDVAFSFCRMGRGLVMLCLCWWWAGTLGAATKVLYLGDSFSKGAFGRTLDAQMRVAGLEVYTSVTGGASAYDWLPEFGPTSTNIGYWEKTPQEEFRVTQLAQVPKLDELVERWKPNLVVIQGGTNMYSVLTSKRRSKEENAAEFERLLHRMGQIVASAGARLYWVTPATAHPQRFSEELQAEMRERLVRVVSRYGRVFDSYAVTRFTDPYPGTDGIHYGPTEAAAWSQLVAKDVLAYAGMDRSARGLAAVRRQAAPAAPAPAAVAAAPVSAADQEAQAAQAVQAAPAGQAAPVAGDSAGRRRGFWRIFRRGRVAERDDGRAGVGGEVRRAELVASGAAVSGAGEAGEGSLEVEVVLTRKSAIQNLAVVTYRSALGVFEYEVVAVRRGEYASRTMRLAHLIVMNNRYTSINERPLGFRMRLEVERLSLYPNLEKIQTVDDLEPAYELPLFVPKL